MYASIRKYKAKPGSLPEITMKVKEEFVEIIGEAPGFSGYYFVDGGKDVFASVSLFESRAGAEESNRLAADWVKKNLSGLIIGPPEITAGEITVDRID